MQIRPLQRFTNMSGWDAAAKLTAHPGGGGLDRWNGWRLVLRQKPSELLEAAAPPRQTGPGLVGAVILALARAAALRCYLAL